MNQTFIEEDPLLIYKNKLLLDQVPANPYNIYCVIFSERKVIMDVIDSKSYVNKYILFNLEILFNKIIY